jgi:hypothetical protein
MRRLALAVSTILTFGLAFLASAAISADRKATLERVAASADVVPWTTDAAAERLWDGGTLPTITVLGRGTRLLQASNTAIPRRFGRAI